MLSILSKVSTDSMPGGSSTFMSGSRVRFFIPIPRSATMTREMVI